MSYTKEEIVARLSEVHDEIKQHPFRLDFATQYIGDYKYLLYTLTEIWCDYIYRGDHQSEEEGSLLRKFGYWIHDYRQNLRTYFKDSFPMQYFDYYEQMLQITHIFIDTGRYDVFYNIDCFWNADNKRVDKIERYELITKELCGIDSPILPRFLPVNTTMQVDDDTILNHINSAYNFSKLSNEERKNVFEKWKRETKPILEWVNARHNETDLKHPIWQSVILA